jgi:hypothetical protein
MNYRLMEMRFGSRSLRHFRRLRWDYSWVLWEDCWIGRTLYISIIASYNLFPFSEQCIRSWGDALSCDMLRRRLGNALREAWILHCIL